MIFATLDSGKEMYVCSCVESWFWAARLIVGARLPWMSVPVLFGVQGLAYAAIEIGWEDNGLATGGIGVLLLLGGLFLSGRRVKFLAILAAGLYVTLLGACLALVGARLAAAQRLKERQVKAVNPAPTT